MEKALKLFVADGSLFYFKAPMPTNKNSQFQFLFKARLTSLDGTG